MNAFALHIEERRGLSRWMLAGAVILAAHAAIVASLALWYARKPVEPNIVPAIAVSFVPIQGSSPEKQDQDVAVGAAMQQAAPAPQEAPKAEEQKLEQEMPPPPQQQADLTVPKAEPKPIDEPKPETPPPAPETRAPPKSERVGRFTEAASNAYDARVAGHLRRFIRYPMEARGASGTVVIRFELNRAGDVIGSEIKRSSGKAVFDRAALAIVRRASPFPPFPPAKPEDRDSYVAPVEFSR